MKPLISVIIPAHNSSKTIEYAIISILSQTYPNLEIIVIDDNSTDNTREVVERLMRDSSNLKYYSLPYDDPDRINKRGRNINAGYMARNYGFEKINGEWITFQDADDVSLLNRIEVQYDLAVKCDVLHVCIDWQKYEDSLIGKKIDAEKILKDSKDVLVTKKDIIKLAKRTKGFIIPFLRKLNKKIPFEFKRLHYINKLFFGDLAPYPGAGNSPLFKKEVIESVKFRKLQDRVWPSFVGRGADRDFNFQVAETFGRSITFRIPLYLWRANTQNRQYDEYKKYILK